MDINNQENEAPILAAESTAVGVVSNEKDDGIYEDTDWGLKGDGYPFVCIT
ncbi:MAG: hypothetical protein UW72_C0005G0058 [Parcubacteria group bacterium GW2011_GWF2_44_7]|nr:MAG: hypothetical protein UW72_C0005G0058 [Parcubacteria group bacterium GW2011_GWF2_44_7]